jgi:hypothetical protein
MPTQQPARCRRYIISRRGESQMKVPNIQKTVEGDIAILADEISEDNRNAVRSPRARLASLACYRKERRRVQSGSGYFRRRRFSRVSLRREAVRLVGAPADTRSPDALVRETSEARRISPQA